MLALCIWQRVYWSHYLLTYFLYTFMRRSSTGPVCSVPDRAYVSEPATFDRSRNGASRRHSEYSLPDATTAKVIIKNFHVTICSLLRRCVCMARYLLCVDIVDYNKYPWNYVESSQTTDMNKCQDRILNKVFRKLFLFHLKQNLSKH